jgi:acetyl esterase/lipase
MTTAPTSLFDPELSAFLTSTAGLFPLGMTPNDIARLRGLGEMTAEMALGDAAVTCTDHEIAGHGGATILVSVIAPRDRAPAGPGIYHIHGGGMVMANRFVGADVLARWAVEHGAVCVSVEYRLAPEHQAPTLVEDCYAGLVWMAQNAALLGIDPGRIVAFGGSAGGGLAAGTALLARDRGGPRLLGQILQCPMIDDRSDTLSAHQFHGQGVWDRQCNVTAWQAVLGESYGTDQVDPYSAPARMTDLSNLPPTFIDVGSAETFRDEAVDYAQRIMAAGGLCELHVWPGAFHGFYSIMPNAAVSRACAAARDAWLGRLLAEHREDTA